MRILEREIVLSEDEVVAYDSIVRKYLKILHAGFIETVINMSPPKGLFLDIGTGSGWIAIGVAKYNPDVEVWGIDLSSTMLKVAQKNAEEQGVSSRTRFFLGDAKRLTFESETFDAVFCHNMLHHLPEPIQMVKEIVRVAKKDGAIIIRDLKRVSRLCAEFHVNIFGLPYNKLMKKEYRDSILAALSENEWKNLFRSIGLSDSRLTKQFITHLSMERPSKHRRNDYLEIPISFYCKPIKDLYISKWFLKR